VKLDVAFPHASLGGQANMRTDLWNRQCTQQDLLPWLAHPTGIHGQAQAPFAKRQVARRPECCQLAPCQANALRLVDPTASEGPERQGWKPHVCKCLQTCIWDLELMVEGGGRTDLYRTKICDRKVVTSQQTKNHNAMYN